MNDLVPGGAAWQQGKLEAGDLILSVAQEGKEPVDVMDMPIGKVVSMIRGPKGTVVVLKVKKPDRTPRDDLDHARRGPHRGLVRARRNPEDEGERRGRLRASSRFLRRVEEAWRAQRHRRHAHDPDAAHEERA